MENHEELINGKLINKTSIELGFAFPQNFLYFFNNK